jgi:hypothetical protein
MWDLATILSVASPPAASGFACLVRWLSPHPIVLMCVFLLAILGAPSYWFGLRKTPLRGRSKWIWFWPPYVTRMQHEWTILFAASLVWTAVILVVSYFFYRVAPYLNANSTPGIVFIIMGLAATLAGLLNTIALLNLRLGHITSFESLFYRLESVVADVQKRHPPSIESIADPEKIYLLDYTPRIGEISQPLVADQTRNLLISLKAHSGCECHVVFLASREYLAGDDPMETDLERFYRRTLGRNPTRKEAAFHRDVAEKVVAAETEIAKLEGDTVAVWRSRRIHSEHYFVTDESALVYYVTPQVNGHTNELKGEKTDDLTQVDFIRDVVIDYIRDAITPHLEFCETCKLVVSFAVGQSNIAEIELLFAPKPSDLAVKELEKIPENQRGHITVDGGKLMPGCSCCRYVCEVPDGMSWVKARLWKQGAQDHRLASPDSYIFSTELITKRSHKQANGKIV